MRSGFNFLAMSEPYVRPDGIKIADAPTIASGASLDSGIWQNADGTYVTLWRIITTTPDGQEGHRRSSAQRKYLRF
jgi:hypothetical protein